MLDSARFRLSLSAPGTQRISVCEAGAFVGPTDGGGPVFKGTVNPPDKPKTAVPIFETTDCSTASSLLPASRCRKQYSTRQLPDSKFTL